jgi:hypothetical protein
MERPTESKPTPRPLPEAQRPAYALTRRGARALHLLTILGAIAAS